MTKLTLTDLTQLSSNETSAVAEINANQDAIETAMENTLSRDGTTPNTMSADIDLNSNDLLNVATLNATTAVIGGVTFTGSNLSVAFQEEGTTASTSATFNVVGSLATVSDVGGVATLTIADPNHDALTGFVANEHIDHSAVTLTAGAGLSGGGDITANRSFAVDINSETDDPSPDGAADYVMTYDASAAGLKKVLLDNLPFTGLSNVVEDTTPQLGGQLDVNGQSLGDGTNELLSFTEDASAVNHVNIENEATGSGPIISAVGDDTNIDLNINAKGTGNIALGNFTFDADQTVGAGQDNYVLTYDNGTGLVSLETSASGATDLNGLTDVVIATPAAGDLLVHDGVDWDNKSINDLTADGTPDGAADYVMTWDASATDVKKVLLNDLPGGGGGISNVVEDTTPQLGGQLDVNGNAIGDGTNELLAFVEDASAVNHVEIENEATGSGPIIRAAGDDTNVDLNINAKGTGNIALGNYTFDADQSVGAGQDNYVLTYDNGTGLVSLEAASGGGGSTKKAIVSNASAVTGINPVGGTVLTWDTDDEDTDSWHDTVTNTNRLTVPAGVSYVDVMARCAFNGWNTDTWGLLRIRHYNSSDVEQDDAAYMMTEYGHNQMFITISALGIPVSSGDYFDVFIQGQSDTSVDLQTTSRFIIREAT